MSVKMSFQKVHGSVVGMSLKITATLNLTLNKTYLTVTFNNLKTLDTIGNCQTSLHRHNITNRWQFELNWSSKLRDNNERRNTLVTCLISRHKILNLRSRNQIRGKLPLSRKLRHFRLKPFLVSTAFNILGDTTDLFQKRHCFEVKRLSNCFKVQSCWTSSNQIVVLPLIQEW